MTLHALFYLLCHWILAFKAKVLFLHAAKVEEGLSVLGSRMASYRTILNEPAVLHLTELYLTALHYSVLL